jgi:DNA polymerase (family 10)
VGNRDRAFQVFAVASFLEARGANPYRVRAYRRAALRLLRMSEDAATHLDEQGELDLPGLGQRLRRKLGELVRTGQLSFHDELIAAEPRPIRALLTVPGIGPKTADRLVAEAGVRGLRSLARAARRGRLQRLRGIGPAREHAWGEAADLLLMPATAIAAPSRGAALTGEAAIQPGLFDDLPAYAGSALPHTATETGPEVEHPSVTAGDAHAPERAA